MASIGVDVYLRGRGGRGGQTARAKETLSTRQSSEVKKIASKKSGYMSAMSSFITTGNISSGVMLIPVLREISVIGKAIDKHAQFGISVYQAHSGEDMLSANMSAMAKAYTTLGGSYIKAGFENILFNRPKVRRQNYMLDYGRNLYMRNIENEKNSFG